MVGQKDDRGMDRQAITLQGWGDGVSGSEGPADPGTDSRAVKGAATFMRPERAAGLRTRWDKCGTNVRASQNHW